MTRVNRNRVQSVGILLPLILCFQNCAPGFQTLPADKGFDSQSSNTPAGTTATPTPSPSPSPSPTATPNPSPTATPPVVTNPCANSTAVLCEDFESGRFDSSIWSFDGQVRPQISTARAYRGKTSMYMNTSSYGYIVHSSRLPVAGRVLYGRMFVNYLSTPGGAWTHWAMAFGGTNAGGPYLWVDGQNDDRARPHFVSGSYGPGWDWAMHDTQGNDYNVIQKNQWICVEWKMDEVANEMLVWLNGVARPAMTINSTTRPGFTLPRINRFYFGHADYQNSGVVTEVYMDEIVLDTKRVGCSP